MTKQGAPGRPPPWRVPAKIVRSSLAGRNRPRPTGAVIVQRTQTTAKFSLGILRLVRWSSGCRWQTSPTADPPGIQPRNTQCCAQCSPTRGPPPTPQRWPSASAHCHLADLLADRRKHAAAEREYRNALRIDPDDADVRARATLGSRRG